MSDKGEGTPVPLSYAVASSETTTSTAVLLGGVGLKLLGVYFLVFTLPSVLSFAFYLVFSGFGRSRSSKEFMGAIVGLVLQLGLGWLLLAKGSAIARRLFRNDGVLVTSLDASQVMKLCVCGIGLFLIATTLSSSVQQLFAILLQTRLPLRGQDVFETLILREGPLTTWLTLALGAVMFLRPGWLAEKCLRRANAL